MASAYDKKLNILFAYPYFTDANIKILSEFDRSKFRLIVDSGAFSAYNSGHEIKFDEYRTFLDKIKFLKYEAAVQLDVVFNPEETHKNYLKHKELGDDVCPVFTRGDDWKYMAKLLKNKEYIFVGGVQKGNGAKEFAKYCLERTRDNKVHYLAFIRPDWINHYMPFSVDASSWSSSAQFGQMSLYMGNGRMKTLDRQDFIKRPSEIILKRFREIGFDYNMVMNLAKESSWRLENKFDYVKDVNLQSLNVFASILSYIKYSVEAQNRVGTKVYLAQNASCYTSMFVFGYNWLLEKGLI